MTTVTTNVQRNDRVTYVDKQTELYTLAHERAVFTSQWQAQPRTNVFEPCGSPMEHKMLRALEFTRPFPYSFNWVVRREPCFMAGGDMPRYALVTTEANNTGNPPFLKCGDLRLRLTLGTKTFWLDEYGDVQSWYHPWGQVHEIDLRSELGLKLTLRAALAGNHALAVDITAEGAGLTTEPTLDLCFGGVVTKTPHYLPEYFHVMPADELDNQISLADDGATLQSTSVPFSVKADCWPRGELEVESGTEAVICRARFRHRLSPSASQLSFVAWIPELGDRIFPEQSGQLLADAEVHYAALLHPYEIETPDPLIDAAFFCGIVNMDYLHHLGSWLEGIHEWNCFFSSNYQISAAISLGQYSFARRALRFFCDSNTGPGDCYLANGQSFMGADATLKIPPHIHEGLPYFILQLFRYWQATRDEETLRYVWDKTCRNFEHNLTFQDSSGNHLLNFKLGCNVFMYQADHLHLPGSAFSPSSMALGSLDLMAQLAEAMGETTRAQAWRRKRDYMQDELLRRFWMSEDGRFTSGIDPEGHVQQAAFYTDYVFPELYTSLPAEHAWLALKACDRDLWKDAERMRIGSYRPILFGNSAVQPAQSCEAAEAYFHAGRPDRGELLLHDAARAATVYTDSPGSFPEYQSETGYGLPDYGFGNPTGAFVHAVIGSLFGLEKQDGGRSWHWRPAIPATWAQARLRLPEAEITINGTLERRTFTLTLSQPAELIFSCVIPGAKVTGLTDADGNAIVFTATGHPSGSQLTFRLSAATGHTITLSTETLPTVSVSDPVEPGGAMVLKLPARGMKLRDPQQVLSQFRIEGETLTARLATQSPGTCIFFLENQAAAYELAVTVPCGRTDTSPPLTVSKGTKTALALGSLFNSNGIYLKNFWRGCLFATYDLTPHLEPGLESMIALGGMRFRVKPDGQNLIWLDRGGYPGHLGAITLPTTTPGTIRIPVQANLAGLELLLASEAPVRLTNMAVATLTVTFDDGGTARLPLIYGRELDCASQPFATHAVSRLIGDRQHYMATALPLPERRWVESLELSIDVADYNLGLFAINAVG